MAQKKTVKKKAVNKKRTAAKSATRAAAKDSDQPSALPEPPPSFGDSPPSFSDAPPSADAAPGEQVTMAAAMAAPMSITAADLAEYLRQLLAPSSRPIGMVMDLVRLKFDPLGGEAVRLLSAAVERAVQCEDGLATDALLSVRHVANQTLLAIRSPDERRRAPVAPGFTVELPDAPPDFSTSSLNATRGGPPSLGQVKIAVLKFLGGQCKQFLDVLDDLKIQFPAHKDEAAAHLRKLCQQKTVKCANRQVCPA